MLNSPMHVNEFNAKVANPCITVENDKPAENAYNQTAPITMRSGMNWTMSTTTFGSTVGETDEETDETVGETVGDWEPV